MPFSLHQNGHYLGTGRDLPCTYMFSRLPQRRFVYI